MEIFLRLCNQKTTADLDISTQKLLLRRIKKIIIITGHHIRVQHDIAYWVKVPFERAFIFSYILFSRDVYCPVHSIFCFFVKNLVHVHYFLMLHFNFGTSQDYVRPLESSNFKFEPSKNNVISSLRPMDENPGQHEQV